ncbi:MAG: hypothetical protein J6V23_01890, partial [Bacteroidaceae bacterium]|nr:hypothetical protein [Bacteroidaceae bacterium]
LKRALKMGQFVELNSNGEEKSSPLLFNSTIRAAKGRGLRYHPSVGKPTAPLRQWSNLRLRPVGRKKQSEQIR